MNNYCVIWTHEGLVRFLSDVFGKPRDPKREGDYRCWDVDQYSVICEDRGRWILREASWDYSDPWCASSRDFVKTHGPDLGIPATPPEEYRRVLESGE